MNEIAFDRGLYDEDTYKKMELEIFNLPPDDELKEYLKQKKPDDGNHQT